MTLFQGSRYRLSTTSQVTAADGAVNTVLPLRVTTVDPPTGSKRYTLKAEDTFESLAFARYGDANKWYILADANPQIFWPLDLESGQEIIIPPKSYAELN